MVWEYVLWIYLYVYVYIYITQTGNDPSPEMKYLQKFLNIRF